MYTTVRKYEGVTKPQEAAKKVQEGFVPIISALPGFVEYLWVDLGHGEMLSVSVFDNLGHAIDSNQVAAVWVGRNLSVLPPATRIENGKVVARRGIDKAIEDTSTYKPWTPASRGLVSSK